MCRGDGVRAYLVRAGPREAATRDLWRRGRGRAYFGAGRGAHFKSKPTAKPTHAYRRDEKETRYRRTRQSQQKNQTQETSWRKPLCLKEAELCPYPSFDDYVFRIQARPPRPRGLHSRRWRTDEAARET